MGVPTAILISATVAKRLVEHLERSGFVVMKRPPIGGGAALGRVYKAYDSGAFDPTVWGKFRAMRGRRRGRQEC
jgi:hypothetical protein